MRIRKFIAILDASGGLLLLSTASGCSKAFDNGCRDTLTCAQGAESGVGGGISAAGGMQGGRSSSFGGEGVLGSSGGTLTEAGAAGQGTQSGGSSSGGAGGSCTNGDPCDPTNPCKNGRTVCGATGEICEETTNRSPGSWCGAPQQCAAGVLTSPDACNTNGECVKGKSTSCTPFACNATGDDCDVTRTFPCGTSMCAVESQYCCYFSSSKLGVCITPDQNCQGYPDLITLRCNTKADCNQGEVCCGIFANYSTELSCMDPKLCAPNGKPVAAIQFCDPKVQTECQLGACVPFDNSSAFPAYNSSFPANHFACSTN